MYTDIQFLFIRSTRRTMIAFEQHTAHLFIENEEKNMLLQVKLHKIA